METTQQKRNVRAEINALEVDECVDFDISRYEYVLSCRTKLSKGTGKKFDSAVFIDNQNQERVNIYRVL